MLRSAVWIGLAALAACEEMEPDGKAFVKGRVTASDGRPVAGARVRLDFSFMSEPAVDTEGGGLVALTDAEGRYAFKTSTAGLAEKIRDAEGHRQAFGRYQTFSVRATHGARAARKFLFDWEGETVAAPDLVLEAGVVGVIVARWSDGAPGAGVRVEVMVNDLELSPDDERRDIVSFEGLTDEKGQMRFGPIPDRKHRVIVNASPDDGLPARPWWDARLRAPFELTLERGRTVRGLLRTADGAPAAGYRVAPWSEEGGDPEAKRVVTTDATGHFEVTGVPSKRGALAIYDRAARPAADPEGHFVFVSDRFGPPTNSLMLRDVPPRVTDVGTLTLPALGTLTVRLEDSRGGRPRSGHVFWHRGRGPYGASASHVGADGVVRFERIPLGIGVRLDVTIEDARHGELQQRFSISAVTEESVTLRVTGAGTVVIRLHPAGAPDEPLTVRHAYAQWHEYHTAAPGHAGPATELRGRTDPGTYPELTVKAPGYRDAVLRSVHVRDDGPTFLDVELEPR